MTDAPMHMTPDLIHIVSGLPVRNGSKVQALCQRWVEWNHGLREVPTCKECLAEQIRRDDLDAGMAALLSEGGL